MARQFLTLMLAFVGGFLAVGAWIWAPKVSSAVSGIASVGPSSVPLFADAKRIGRPETAPVIRGCIARIMDFGPDQKVEPSAAYSMLKMGSMQADVGAMIGKSEREADRLIVTLAVKWGELANCIYTQDDRELCDRDNRAAAVETTTKFFAYAKQAEAIKAKGPGAEARGLDGITDRLLLMLRNHRHYGTLVAGDFSSFAAPEIMRIMREEKQTRDICKR